MNKLNLHQIFIDYTEDEISDLGLVFINKIPDKRMMLKHGLFDTELGLEMFMLSNKVDKDSKIKIFQGFLFQC